MSTAAGAGGIFAASAAAAAAVGAAAAGARAGAGNSAGTAAAARGAASTAAHAARTTETRRRRHRARSGASRGSSRALPPAGWSYRLVGLLLGLAALRDTVQCEVARLPRCATLFSARLRVSQPRTAHR